MPGQTTPPDFQLRQMLIDFDQRLKALQTQQTMVFTDPTGASGDPAHAHAVVVTGSLKQIAGINAFGIAVWTGAAWSQLLGGAPLFSEAGTSGSEGTSSTTYTTLTSAGPAVTVPLAGDYLVEIGAYIAPGAETAYMSYDIGGTGAVDADAIIVFSNSSQTGGNYMRTRRKTLAANTTLTAKYRSGAGAAISFANRWMRVTRIA